MVESVVLEADLGAAETDVPVEVVYRLRPAGGATVPLEALRLGGGRIEGLGAEVRGRGRPVEWDREGPRRAGGRVVLEPADGDAGGDGAPAVLEVTLRYRVRSAREEGGRIRVPVVRVPWSPAAAEPGTFTARALVPDSLRVVETFPTVLGSARPLDGGRRAYVFELQVVPSVVSVRVRSADDARLSFTRGVDLAVGALLAVLAFLGWRALRRQAAAHGSGAAGSPPSAAGGSEGSR